MAASAPSCVAESPSYHTFRYPAHRNTSFRKLSWGTVELVGWHALTLPQKPKALLQSRHDALAVLLAIGLDPARSIIFHQDHAKLASYGTCLDIQLFDPLRKVETDDDVEDSRNANNESEVDESLLNAGLFTYPVLQAADILVYRATHVPVGEDQTQHLELSRDIAQIFNRNYKPFFPIPEQLSTPTRRILSLKDPNTKMSKSSPDIQSRILLTDSHAQIKSKIRAAVTDSITGISYDPKERPGTSNLLAILGACVEKDPIVLASEYEGKGHGSLKADVIEAVEELVRNPRSEFERLRQETGYLDHMARDGATHSTNPTELEAVLDSEIKEWHFRALHHLNLIQLQHNISTPLDIYFHQNNVDEHHAALELRDKVLRLRRDGAFIAVPLYRVNLNPIGPHPVGSYEIWVPSESFASVFSFLCMNRGELSVLVHPLTREERADHEVRNAWIGPPFPLDLSALPVRSEEIPFQYPTLKLGYSSKTDPLSIEQRLLLGDNVERVLLGEKYAARAPPRA
ncbi:hypothetical protein ONZ45_g9534 [Pleurotus djamor]|nr:hypothetical protein ONZ45_g9534 [Pleurotus djamor]